jgi:hypothetical protein
VPPSPPFKVKELREHHTFGNRSEEGADTQAILMTVFQTLKLRGVDVLSAALDLAKDAIVSKHARKYAKNPPDG